MEQQIYEIEIICQNIRITDAICCNNFGDFWKNTTKMAEIWPLINLLYIEPKFKEEWTQFLTPGRGFEQKVGKMYK